MILGTEFFITLLWERLVPREEPKVDAKPQHPKFTVSVGWWESGVGAASLGLCFGWFFTALILICIICLLHQTSPRAWNVTSAKLFSDFKFQKTITDFSQHLYCSVKFHWHFKFSPSICKENLELPAVSQGIIIAPVWPIFRCFLISVNSLLEKRHIYFCFQEAISLYIEMID